MTGRPLTVVTGGSRGIGAATCAGGWRPRATTSSWDTRPTAAAAEAVAGDVSAPPAGGCATVRLDVADPAGVDALFDAAAALGGT